MNIIDKKFNHLVKEIKKYDLIDIFNNIKNNYLNLNSNIQLSLEDYFQKFPYWGKLNKNENNFDELYNRALSLKEHIEDYVWLYNKLEDYRSKQILFSILNNWYQFDFNSLKASYENNYSHYFDLDIIKCNDEVIVDLGAYTGDTIIDYINNYGIESYKKIYCYEITEESMKILKNNLKYYPNIEYRNNAASNALETLFLNESEVDSSANMVSNEGVKKIQAVTLDNDIDDDITLIKMDIEGYEKKALEGCQNHILKNHPKLLISVYHNHEDLILIPKMINKLKDDYKFYLRYYGNNIFPTEVVLIAI